MRTEEFPYQRVALVGGGTALLSYLALRKRFSPKTLLTDMLLLGGCAAGSSLVAPTVVNLISPKNDTAAAAGAGLSLPPSTGSTSAPSASGSSKGTNVSIEVTPYGTAAFHFYTMRKEGPTLEAMLIARNYKANFTYGGKTYKFNANWGKFGTAPNEVRKVQVLDSTGATVKLSTIFGADCAGKTFTITVN